MELVLLFPGQGSQKPGMGKDLAEAYDAARAVFEEVDQALDEPLSRMMFDGPAEHLTLTQNAQPALLAHGAAVWATVRERLSRSVRAAAGHSLGEFTAYHAAGALTLSATARLVRRRGELMCAAGRACPGTMAALLGELAVPVEAICRTASGEMGCVVPANFNDPVQVVVSGDTAAVERAMELATGAGAKRAVRLAVSGAFHSPLMEPAAEGLAAALDETDFRDPAFPVISNVTAQGVATAAAARPLLVRQLTAPVQWTGIVETLARRHPQALFIEMGPGAVLTKLVRRIAPGVTTATCGTAAEVDTLLDRLH